MRPYWIRVGPKSNESALVSDGKEDLAISLLEESAPLTSCSVQVAICPEDEQEEAEPMRD